MMDKLQDQAAMEVFVSEPEAQNVQDPEPTKPSGVSPTKVSAETSKENESRVTTNGEDFGDGPQQGVIGTANEVAVATDPLAADGKIVALGTREVFIEDGDLNGVSSLLKLQDSCETNGATATQIEGSNGLLPANGGIDFTDDEGISVLVDIRVDKIREFGHVENGDDIIEVAGVSDSNKEGDEEVGEYEDSDFRVGDFVWAKIKHHPRWPGQIYDPSDASENALKIKDRVKGKILVAFFGDGTFSWCSASQLLPFKEHFDEMSKQSLSKKFLTAVQEAVDEFGRIVEMKMMCSSMPEKERPLAVNAGIKEGVYVPDGELLTDLFESQDCLADLKCIALSASCCNLLELRVLTARLSAFYHSKGCTFLAAYHEPQPIRGLEDKTGDEECIDGNQLVEVQIEGVIECESHNLQQSSQPDQTNQILLPKSPIDWPPQKMKEKSIAEIMGAETERKKDDKRVTDSERKKRKESSTGHGSGSNDLKVESRQTSKRLKHSRLSSTAEVQVPNESDVVGYQETDNAAPSAATMGGEARTERDDDMEVKDQSEQSSVMRERKLSKYLSPPYTNIVRGHNRKEIEEVLRVTSEAQLSEQEFTETTPGMQVDESDEMDVGEIEAPAAEVLSCVRSAALNPQSKNYALDKCQGFLSMFRNSVYNDGANYTMHNQSEEANEADTSETVGHAMQQTKGNKSREVKTNVQKPKKMELISDQSKKEEQTSGKSRKRKSHDEMKSDNSEKLKKKGKQTEEGTSMKKTPVGQAPAADLLYIKEKLELMSQLLDGSEETKSQLQAEMKGLLQEVSTMVRLSSSS